MRRRTGAILRDTRPETIITSAWRGLARKTSEPKRARSWRESVVAIISMAQQASPKVAGQSEDLRAQLTSESSRVVMMSGSASAMKFSKPIRTPCGEPSGGAGGRRRDRWPGRALPRLFEFERPGLGLGLGACARAPLEQTLLQDVDVADEEEDDERHHLDVDERAEVVRREALEDDRPRDHENQLDVEEDEDHRDEVELHREALARRAHRVFAALVGHRLRPRRLVLADELREQDVARGEAHGDEEHERDWQVVGQTEHTILPSACAESSGPLAAVAEFENHGTRAILVHAPRRVKPP